MTNNYLLVIKQSSLEEENDKDLCVMSMISYMPLCLRRTHMHVVICLCNIHVNLHSLPYWIIYIYIETIDI